LAVARFDLIARHDDDDLMLPERIHEQAGFLGMNPDISVVTSWAYLIDERGRTIGQSCPQVDMEVGLATLDPSKFVDIINPATMYRKAHVLDVGGYRLVKLEDRDLWGRLVTSGYRIAVHPRFVVRHRRHSNSLMSAQLDALFEYGDYIDHNIVRRLQGQAEMSLDEYRAAQASTRFVRRLWRKRKRKSQIAYRRATMLYSRRLWLPFLRDLAVATALAPIATLRRLRSKAVG
jgi:hypothetical protein